MRQIAKMCAVLAVIIANQPAKAQRDPRDVPPSRCPLIGTAKSQNSQILNQKKNREVAPRNTQMNLSITLEQMLAPGNDRGRFSETQGAEIVGWVVNVEQGGHPETANCGSMSKQFTDTHITVGLSPDASPTDTIVVEVTPRWRDKMNTQGIDWGTDTLHDTLIGHKVRFRGWMMFDLDHIGEAENLAPGNPKNWRRTIWEIHPITEMEVVQ